MPANPKFYYKRQGPGWTFESNSEGIGRMLNSRDMLRAMEDVADRIKEHAEVIAPVYGEDEELRKARAVMMQMPTSKQVLEIRRQRALERKKRQGKLQSPSIRGNTERINTHYRGRYKASFKVKSHLNGGATNDRAEAVVYNDAPEAIYVEFGHHGREPEHILARAAFRPFKGF